MACAKAAGIHNSYLFDHCADRYANSSVYQYPTRMGWWEGMATVVNARQSEARKLNKLNETRLSSKSGWNKVTLFTLSSVVPFLYPSVKAAYATRVFQE